MGQERTAAMNDAAEQQRVIGAATENLEARYVDHDAARKMADTLLMHERNGDDTAVTNGTFAGLLTKQMRDGLERCSPYR